MQAKSLLMSKTGSAYDMRLLPRLNKKKTDILSLTRGKINYERACGKRALALRKESACPEKREPACEKRERLP